MTFVWLIAAAAPRPWMLPAALVATLAVQVGGFLAAEKLIKAIVRRRRQGARRAHA